MEDKKDLIKNRKEKIVQWIKNPYNAILLLIIVLAIIVRLYYFNLTKTQPLWWDEAEYMAMAKAWAFNMDYNFLPVRPILLSLITALFLKIANTEFLTRFFLFIFSIASVPATYYLGKEIYHKKKNKK